MSSIEFLTEEEIKSACTNLVNRNVPLNLRAHFSGVFDDWSPARMLEMKFDLEIDGQREYYGSLCRTQGIRTSDFVRAHFIAFDAGFYVYKVISDSQNAEVKRWGENPKFGNEWLGHFAKLSIVGDTPHTSALSNEIARKFVEKFGAHEDLSNRGLWLNREWGLYKIARSKLDSLSLDPNEIGAPEFERALRTYRLETLSMYLIKNFFPGGRSKFLKVMTDDKYFGRRVISKNPESLTYFCGICSDETFIWPERNGYFYFNVENHFLSSWKSSMKTDRDLERFIGAALEHDVLDQKSTEFGDAAREHSVCAECLHQAIENLSISVPEFRNQPRIETWK